MGGAGPVRGLLGGKDLTGRLFLVSNVTAPACALRLQAKIYESSLKNIDPHRGRERGLQCVRDLDALFAPLSQDQAGKRVHALVGRGEGVVPGQLANGV